MAVTFRYSEDAERGPRVPSEYNPNYSRLVPGSIQWAETEHVGAVLSEGHESCRIMSDVWGDRYFALVWDFEENAPRKVTLQVVDYGCGYSDDRVARAWRNWHHTAEVDATDEVKALYQAWQDAQAEAETLRRFEKNLADARERAGEVSKGSRVELSRKRCKVPFGTKGEVFWVGDGSYGPRVGFTGDDGETYWTALRNVSVVEGHEDWSDSCQDCGGASWLPANDGKGGTVTCPACERRYEERKAEREREEAERRAAIEAEEASGGYIGRGTKVEVVASEGRDAPVGAAGKVFWRGANRYGEGERVGFKDSAGETHWANVENVRVPGAAPKGAVAKGSSYYSVPSPSNFGSAA